MGGVFLYPLMIAGRMPLLSALMERQEKVSEVLNKKCFLKTQKTGEDGKF